MTAVHKAPVCVADFEVHAKGRLPLLSEVYFSSGSHGETSLVDNKVAFGRYRFRPRVLRDVSKRDLSTSILGQSIAFPVGVSPMSLCCLAHPDGEMGIARACERLGIPFCLSTVSSTSIEDIAKGAPHSIRWFQLYIFKERRITEWLVRRAEAAGFSGLVLTVDAPVVSRRLESMRNPFSVPDHLRIANLDSDGIFKTLREEAPNEPYISLVGNQLDPSVSWDDVAWLRDFTRLPIIVKGILCAEDALEAVSHGVAAVWVSNHGGRQLDSVPATIDVLSQVVEAVAGRCEVYLDGGVRSGYDVIKALALGARAVFMGRPALWGLVYNGGEGVGDLLDIVRAEVDNGIALLGARSVADLNRKHVTHEHLLKPKL